MFLRSSWFPLAVYFASLAAWGIGALDPGGRIWGVDAWAPLPGPVGWGFLCVGVAAGVALGIRIRPAASRGVASPDPAGSPARRPPSGRARDLAIALAVAGGAGALFWIFRVQAHFLGDGYQNLARLAEDHFVIKWSARGTSRLLVALREFFGDGRPAALAAYQWLAVASGVGFVLLSSLGISGLPGCRFTRVALTALLLTGGATLQFFGYAENYALFLCVVLGYALLGAHIARTGRGAWAAPGLVGAAILLHVLGFTLVPSLLWLLLSRTSVGDAWRRLSFARRAGALIGAAAVGALALSAATRASLTLQLVLVPFVAHSFTLDGYTAFSPAHLLDTVNLSLLLTPGIAVLAAAALGSKGARSAWRRDPSVGFLFTLAVTTSAAVFVLDPKLGMPRDWDVFAFAGLPWLLAVGCAWAAAASARPALRAYGPLAVLLGALVLAPRVWTLGDAGRAVVPFRKYLALDHQKSRNSRIHLVNYERARGRDDLAEAEIDAWDRDYPARTYVEQANDARNRGDFPEAIRLNQHAIRISPLSFDAHNNLGSVYMLTNQLLKAREALEIAHAIDPLNPGILLNIGSTYLMAGDLDGAADAWKRAHAVNPTGFHENRNLARVAERQGNRAQYEYLIERAAGHPDASGRVLVEWGEILRGRGLRARGAAYMRAGLERGLDTDARRQLLARFPELAPSSPDTSSEVPPGG